MEDKILDSGKRTEFNTGAVRDIQKGKGRCDLMPLGIIGSIIGNDNILYDIQRFRIGGDVNYIYDAVNTFCRNRNLDLPTMLLELSIHFENGKDKYGARNWEKGLPLHCYINSAVRHYLKCLRCDDDERHDRAFVWNLVCGAYTYIYNKELDDFTDYGFNERGDIEENTGG